MGFLVLKEPPIPADLPFQEGGLVRWRIGSDIRTVHSLVRMPLTSFFAYPSTRLLPHPFPKILGRNCLDFSIWVSVRKRLGDAAFLFRIPLEFESIDL